MKLYCIKLLNNNQIVDVQHMFANNDKEILKRMDEFLEECRRYKFEDEYNGYSFYEVYKVDGIDINKAFEKYKTVNNKIIKKEEK